jgi:NAD(P)-dependent dehydrogenase (short-subunit alcohol dehydrogenase family)
VSEFRFDGRVAVITGAGRGLGRAYAMLLASRGASVVVNDVGGSIQGSGTDPAVASSVAGEIIAAGGEALADAHDVSTVAGAEALVASALDRFGRVDILVANAGIIDWAGFPEADAANLERHLAVHVGGSFHTARAMWPHMVEQRYGRIVLTTSTGVFGLRNNLGYATAKAGVIGMARSLATAGARHGIAVNLIAPAAHTRMAAGEDSPAMAPELVAPMVAYLAHENCPVTGECYVAGFGRFARIVIATNDGYLDATGTPSIEDVATYWAEINDLAALLVPGDVLDWSKSFTAHLDS